MHPDTDWYLFRNLLANLWAHGAILQCSFNQESVDFLIVVYHGQIDLEVIFSSQCSLGFLARLSSSMKQTQQTNKQYTSLWSFSTSPYIALLLEPGNESIHRTSKLKIKVTVLESWVSGVFCQLTEDWMDATKDLALGRSTSSELMEMQKVLKIA